MNENEDQLSAASNPFSNSARAQLATVQVEQERAVAEVQAAMILARRFPRDPVQAMDRILNACTRPGLAEGALYTYSRGGTDISGPSIRLAEAMAQAWGNIQFGIRELEQREGESTVEAFAWDIETNTRQTKVFQIAHERHTKSGVKKLTDPRDIYELVANNGARRLRACILGVIPGDVTEEAVKQCEVTLRASADTSPENMQKMCKAFADNFGVTQKQIETRIQRRVESIQPAQVIMLKKIYASMKDGMSTVEDWFESTNGEGQATTTPKIFQKKPQTDSKPESAATPSPTPQPPVQDEQAERAKLLEAIELQRTSDGVGSKTIRAWAVRSNLAASESLMLKSYATEALRAVLEKWEEIKALPQ